MGMHAHVLIAQTTVTSVSLSYRSDPHESEPQRPEKDSVVSLLEAEVSRLCEGFDQCIICTLH